MQVAGLVSFLRAPVSIDSANIELPSEIILVQHSKSCSLA